MPLLSRNISCWLLVVHSCALFALPSPVEIVAGKASSSQNGSVLRIEAENRTILEFEKFQVDPHETVQFIQPHKDATLLGRITGSDPSQILGSLKANGRLFLVNPNGIYFGPSSIIDVHSLIASTLSILNEDFLSDRFVFQEVENSKGKIVHEGVMNAAGSVALLSPSILNKGSIIAKTGSVILGAAKKVTLDFGGDGLLQFALEGDLEQAVIENHGLLSAANGIVDLSLRSAKKSSTVCCEYRGDGSSYFHASRKWRDSFGCK